LIAALCKTFKNDKSHTVCGFHPRRGFRCNGTTKKMQ